MTDQEQHPPQQNTSFAPNPIIGAVPALAGLVIAFLHLRRPIVHPDDQSILMNACLGLLCVSLALWLFWGLERVAQRVCDRFDERHDRLEALAADNMQALKMLSTDNVAALKDSICKATRKLARLCKLIEDAEKRLTDTETRLQQAETQLAAAAEKLGDITADDGPLHRIEQQGIALGRAFIDDGLPDRSHLN